MVNKYKIIIDKNFYDINRKSLIEYRTVKERLSSRIMNYDYNNDAYLPAAYDHLIKGFYSIFNYITGEFVPCLIIKNDTLLSFCSITSNHIQLGTGLLKNEHITQQQRVDALYAIMLHEMFHKKYTNNHILKYILNEEYDLKDMYSGSKKFATIIKTILPNFITIRIFNILEDRRIERLGLNEFPGYVFFFDSLRELMLNEHLKRDFNNIEIYTFPEQYLIYKILLPDLLEPAMDSMMEVLSLTKNKKYTSFITDIIKKISDYILKYPNLIYSNDIIDILKATYDIVKILPPQIQDIYKEYDFDIIDCCNPEQGGNIIAGASDGMEELIKKIIKDEEQFNKQNSNIKKPYREEKIDLIEIDHLGYENFTIYNPKCNSINKNFYDRALTLSANISRNLGFLASRLNMIEYNHELEEGEIDEDDLYSISFSKNIFFSEEERPGFEFDFGILVDESGSMGEPGSGMKSKRDLALLACLIILLGAKDDEHVNLFVYGHSTNRHSANKGVELYEYYNKKRGITDWKNIFSMGCSGSNADGYAIAKVGETMILDSNAREKILVVISDGEPSAYGYSGVIGENHTKSVVELLERKGIEVIQICVDNIERSPFMFKNFIPFENDEKFIKHFTNFLHKKLLKFTDNL